MKLRHIGIALFLLTGAALADRYEAGACFLLLSPDARANGMGGAGVTSTQGHCAYYNPGNVGLTAFNKTFTFNYSNNAFQTDLEIGPLLSDVFSMAFTCNTGLLKLNLPLNAGLGVQYSNNSSSYWPYTSTEKEYNSYSIGAGFDHFLQLGLGLSIKNISADIIDGEVSAYDYGLTARLPVCRLLKDTELVPRILPEPWSAELTIAYGASRSNNGSDSVQYLEDKPSKPLPKSGRDGFSIEFNSTFDSLDFIYCTYAREVTLDFVEVEAPPAPPVINSGFEFGIFDIFEYRTGRMFRYDYYYDKIEDKSVTISYRTNGWTLRPTAGLKIVYYEFLQSEYGSPIIDFIIKNLDFSYTKSLYLVEEPGVNTLDNSEFTQYELTFGTDFGMLYK